MPQKRKLNVPKKTKRVDDMKYLCIGCGAELSPYTARMVYRKFGRSLYVRRECPICGRTIDYRLIEA